MLAIDVLIEGGVRVHTTGVYLDVGALANSVPILKFLASAV